MLICMCDAKRVACACVLEEYKANGNIFVSLDIWTNYKLYLAKGPADLTTFVQLNLI